MSMAGNSLPARPRRDWSARSRDTIADALRYTRFVVRMKRALLLAAFAVIFAVLGFFVVQRTPRQLSLSYERLGSIKNDGVMIKPRLTGTDAQGEPFVITADSLVQDARNPKRATLRNVEADLTARHGWFNVRAAAGLVDMAAQHLELSGGIQFFDDTGYQFSTPAAHVDLKSYVVTGEQGVSGQGPLGALGAERFAFDRASGHLTLTGKVHVVLTGRLK